MSPVTHFLVGWVVANAGKLNRRDRAIVAIAGIVPDIDALGIIAELLTRNSDRPLYWWSKYHHVLTHNLGFGILVTVVAFILAARRWKTAAFALLAFHLHILGDLAGGKGPEGYMWPINYLLLFSNAWQLAWKGQWELNAWPNFAVTGVVLIATFYLAWKRFYSPLEMASAAADRTLVETLRNRFPGKLQPTD